MKINLRWLIAVLAALFLLGAICVAQDVPKGVTYRKATESQNNKAKAALEHALVEVKGSVQLLGGVVTCGPILWRDLKEHQEELIKDSTPVTMFLSVPEQVKAEGRGLRTQEQRDRFWKIVLERFPDLQKGIVRSAKANEIQFYWATIPFDIEEPFFVIETPTDVFVANLTIENNEPVLFWLDRVDDLRKLKD